MPVAISSAILTSLAWTMPAMPSLIVWRYCSSASTNAPASKPSPLPPGKRPGIRSCGCDCSTWYCSTKASTPSFQLTGRRAENHHSARIDSIFQASSTVAKGSMHWRSGGASWSRLIQAQPPQTSQRTDTKLSSDGSRLCGAKELAWVTRAFWPSVP